MGTTNHGLRPCGFRSAEVHVVDKIAVGFRLLLQLPSENSKCTELVSAEVHRVTVDHGSIFSHRFFTSRESLPHFQAKHKTFYLFRNNSYYYWPKRELCAGLLVDGVDLTTSPAAKS
jgi:hypothetical protein